MIFRPRQRFITAVFLTSTLMVAACEDKKPDAASAAASGSAAPKASSTSAATSKPTAASTPTPASTPAKSEEPASNLPVKGPWEAVKITFLKDDPKDGSPYFKMENLGGKTVTVCFMDFYGYDEGGKQVAYEALSWNGELKGGKVDESIYTKKHDNVKTWEAVYHGIKFDGDAEVTMDSKRAPSKRPKGG